jgi:hypothetical protein
VLFSRPQIPGSWERASWANRRMVLVTSHTIFESFPHHTALELVSHLFGKDQRMGNGVY